MSENIFLHLFKRKSKKVHTRILIIKILFLILLNIGFLSFFMTFKSFDKIIPFQIKHDQKMPSAIWNPL